MRGAGMPRFRFTTWGPVRGDCGHVHRTRPAAEACLRRDQHGCARQGGYSDRRIRRIFNRADIASYDIRYGPGTRDAED